MNKVEMLKKQAQANTMNLYLSNESTSKEETIQPPIKQNTEPLKQVNDSKKYEKMISARVGQEIIEKIDKYAYIMRLKKQDLILMIFDSFFQSNEVQDVLKQYDDIKGAK